MLSKLEKVGMAISLVEGAAWIGIAAYIQKEVSKEIKKYVSKDSTDYTMNNQK